MSAAWMSSRSRSASSSSEAIKFLDKLPRMTTVSLISFEHILIVNDVFDHFLQSLDDRHAVDNKNAYRRRNFRTSELLDAIDFPFDMLNVRRHIGPPRYFDRRRIFNDLMPTALHRTQHLAVMRSADRRKIEIDFQIARHRF